MLCSPLFFFLAAAFLEFIYAEYLLIRLEEGAPAARLVLLFFESLESFDTAAKVAVFHFFLKKFVDAVVGTCFRNEKGAAKLVDLSADSFEVRRSLRAAGVVSNAVANDFQVLELVLKPRSKGVELALELRKLFTASLVTDIQNTRAVAHKSVDF